MKLQEKFQKLFLIKYRYKVVTTLNNYNQKKYFGYNIFIENELVTFYQYRINKSMLNDDDLKIEDRYKITFDYFLKTKIISTISLVLIFLMFFFANFFIRDIRFTNEETYNYYVLEDVKKEVSYIGPFKKMNINLNDLSNQLRQKYYNYAYIGVRKVAGTIYIDIQITDEFESNDNKLNMPCDILSNVDGKVIGFEIQKGIPVVNINQIIKKGDLIITGNINYQTDPSNLSNLIHSEGVVLIEYAQYEKISVLKKYLFEYLDNSVIKNYSIKIFNKEIGNNRVDDINKKIIKNNIFQLSNKLNVYQNTIYTIANKEINIDIDEAKTMSEIKIYTNFINKKQNDNEKIKYIKYISYYETEEEYVFCYLVKYVSSNVIKRYY